MSFRHILRAIALFCQFPKGIPALQVFSLLEAKPDFRCVLIVLHKLREAMIREMDQDVRPFQGDTEADPTQISGHMRPTNERRKWDPKQGKLIKTAYKMDDNGPGKRFVTTIVERGPFGRMRSKVHKTEIEARDFIKSKVAKGQTILYTDKATGFEKVFAEAVGDDNYRPVNHSALFYQGDSHTNNAESGHARLKRSIRGIYHRIASSKDKFGEDVLTQNYAEEIGWRHWTRNIPNGERYKRLIRACGLGGKSIHRGYWQWREAA